jgi:hypothetical protein
MLATATNPATLNDTDLVAEIARANKAADLAKAMGDRSTETTENILLVAAIGEMMDRGYILDAADTHIGAKVQGTGTGRIGTVSQTYVTGEIVVDWGSVQVEGFPNSRYSTFTTEVLMSGGLLDGYLAR